MFVEILAALLALSHIATIAAIIAWFALGKPRSAREFWIRFRREFLSLRPR